MLGQTGEDQAEAEALMEQQLDQPYVHDEDMMVTDTRAAIEVPPKNFLTHMQPDYMTSVSQQTGSKSFVSNLQKQLDEEREARSKLENELKQLKDMSTEIQAHLKMNPNAQIL